MNLRGKRLFAVAGVTTVVLAVVVALLPTLASFGPGRGVVENLIEAQVNGVANVPRAKLRWFGPQTVSGVTITDPSGRKAAEVDVKISFGLLALVFNAIDDLEVDVTGEVRGELREDGSTSFGELLAVERDAKKTGALKAATDGPEPISLAGIPRTRINLDDVNFVLDIREERGVETISVPKLKGAFSYLPGGEATLSLSGATTGTGGAGSIEVTATAVNLFAADGRMTPKGALIDAKVLAAGLPVPFDDRVKSIDKFELTAKTDDLADRLGLDLVLDTALADSDPSGLNGTIVVNEPFAADGTPTFALDRIEGEITGSRVPTSLLQPLLASTPIRLARDVGSSLDVAASVGAGEKRDVAIDVRGEHARIELAATVGADRAIVGTRLRAEARISPELAGGALESAALVEVASDSFRVPAPGADGALALGGIALDAVISMKQATRLRLTASAAEKGPSPGLSLGALSLALRTDALAGGLRVNGGADLAGGRLEIDETLTGLIDEAGSLSIANAKPVGSITLSGVDASSLAGLADGPFASKLASVLLAEAISATVETSARPQGLAADVALRSAGLTADVAIVRREDAIEVDEATATVSLTPALVAALQGDAERRVTLAEPSKVTVRVEPVTLSRSSDGAYAVPTKPIAATVDLQKTRLAHPAVDDPIVLAALTAAVTATLGDAPAYSVRAETNVRQNEKDRALGNVVCDLTAVTEDGSLVPRGVVTVSALALDQVERVLGYDAGDISGWLGDSGTIALELTGDAAAERVALRTDFPNVFGVLRAALDDEAIVMESDGLDVKLTKTLLDRLLMPSEEEDEGEKGAASGAKAAASGAKAAATVSLVAADMPLRVVLPRLRIPRTLLAGEPVDAKAVAIDATITGGPLKLADAKGVFSTVEGLTGSVDCDGLDKGIHLVLTGRATGRGAAEPGVISIDGRIVNVTKDEKTVDFEGARLHMEARAERVPTVVADSLLGLEGLLVAAAGPEMNATFTSRGFSRRSGRVDARIETSTGFITGQIRGRAAGLRTTTDDPLRGELQILKPLRELLLMKIHPILADIRSTEHPLRFKVTNNATVPLDGDLSGLKGDLEINVGKVEFDAGSTTLGFLRLVDGKDGARATFPGLIEPIVAKIRNGVVSYDRFAVQIDRYTLAYQGKIDLVNGSVDLRTELPLAGLAMSVKELEGYADKIIVPVVTRGTFGSLETKIDPSFDLAGAAVDAGFRGALNEVLEEKGLRLGDMLDGIFKKKKKQEDAGGG